MKIQTQTTNAIMKGLIQPKKDTERSRRRASFTGLLILSLGFGLSFLGIRSAIACDEICEAYPTFNTGFGYGSLVNKTTGISDTAFGYFALGDNTTGSDNTAVGEGALSFITTTSGNTAVGSDCLSMSTGSFNTAVGEKVMYENDALSTVGDYNTGVGGEALAFTSGSYNAAFGYLALAGDFFKLGNNFGSNNTGIGSFALYKNSGSFNTAIGDGALEFNGSGQSNTASGLQAMYGDSTNLSSGNNNTATGYESLFSYTSGSNNTATGYQALYKDTTGGSNTATGIYSLYFNVSGNYNTATGRGALYKNTASNNTATGYQALNVNGNGHDNAAFGMRSLQSNTTGYSNTALGSYALQTNIGGYNNTAVGLLAGYYITGNNNIDIGNQGVTGESNTIRIGTTGVATNAYIAGTYGTQVASGIGVIIDSTGHLGTTTSSARFKENIQPMDKASEAILSLQPVTFRYKKELDQKGIAQFGLVAEQVDKVDPDLVVRDNQGKPYSVRYEAVNAMLLNEFLKEHRKVEKLEAALAQQEKRFAEREREIKALSAGLQKIGDQLELTKPAPRVVVNNP
jgi:hypothetical protein